jgi:hypothetical protein
MPAEIEALIESVAAGAHESDQNEAIRERLKEHLDLYKVSRYRLTPSGQVLVERRTPQPRRATIRAGEAICPAR